MDFTAITIGFIKGFWYFIPLLIIAAVFKSPWFKGVLGEFIVNLSTKFLLNKNDYHLLKNVTLPTEDGTTQIDHIIVSVYGIFVVETKNMKGWIFGKENQRTWTQKIYKHSNKFQNPLHQNYKHVKTLQHILGLTDSQIHSLVVFVGDSTFKTNMPDNVTYGGGYARYIKSKKQPVLSNPEVTEIIARIKQGRLNQSFKTNRAHVKHVKDIQNKKKTNISCPKCGNPMKQRKSKSGNTFWGCSMFPKCRGTKSI